MLPQGSGKTETLKGFSPELLQPPEQGWLGSQKIPQAFTIILLYKGCCSAWVWAQLRLPYLTPQQGASGILDAPREHHSV